MAPGASDAVNRSLDAAEEAFEIGRLHLREARFILNLPNDSDFWEAMETPDDFGIEVSELIAKHPELRP